MIPPVQRANLLAAASRVREIIDSRPGSEN